MIGSLGFAFRQDLHWCLISTHHLCDFEHSLTSKAKCLCSVDNNLPLTVTVRINKHQLFFRALFFFVLNLICLQYKWEFQCIFAFPTTLVSLITITEEFQNKLDTWKCWKNSCHFVACENNSCLFWSMALILGLSLGHLWFWIQQIANEHIWGVTRHWLRQLASYSPGLNLVCCLSLYCPDV